MFRYRDPQLQVGENYLDLCDIQVTAFTSQWYRFKAHFKKITFGIWLHNC